MKYIVFDTSWLEGTGYDFAYAPFRCIQYTDYQVLIPQIMDEEIRRHLLKRIESFVNDFNDSHSKTRFLKIICKLPDPWDIEKYKKVTLAAYDAFKEIIRAQVVPSKLCDIDNVLEDYFEEQGPFAKKGKKSEFPDAIAINSVLNFVKDNEAIVFTKDDDWKNVFASKENVTVYDKKDDLIKVISIDDLAGEVIDIYLEDIIDVFSKHIESSFTDYFTSPQVLYPDNYCLDDLSVDDFDFEFIEYNEIHIMSKDEVNNKISAAISFKYHFSINVSFDDDSESSMDKEDHMKRNVIRRNQTISGEESGYCFVDFDFENNTFSKIVSHKLNDFDLNLKEANNYEIDDEVPGEEDYYDIPY